MELRGKSIRLQSVQGFHAQILGTDDVKALTVGIIQHTFPRDIDLNAELGLL